MKKLLMLLLSVVIAFSAVACGGNNSGLRDDTSYFFIITTDSGHGSAGTKEMARRFEEKFKDYSFAEGKTGVVVDVEAKGSMLYTTSIASEAYHAYINPASINKDMIGQGDFINIDEFFKTEIPGEPGVTIEDKIPEDGRARLQGTSAKHGTGYYFAPGVSFMGGLTYDKNVFDEKGFYFTAPGVEYDEISEEWSSLLEMDVRWALVASEEYQLAIQSDEDWTGWNSNHYLSCGPDGIYETYDDGMPSSLDELVMLCEKMKNDSVTPFVLSGKYPLNHHYCTDGLTNALLGPENMYTMKTFESDAFEIVTGYEENQYVWGNTQIKKPKTATVKVTPSQGYYATWSTARYYNAAFWKLAVDQNWFTSAVDKDTSHIEAEAEFIFSGYDSNRERSAIMCEASYWINESQERNNFTDFTKMGYEINGLEREKQIKWMSLPRQINGTVEENQGTPETFMYLGVGSCNVFNAVYANDPEAMEMIKQWLLFIYSDEILQFITSSTGCPPYLNIDIDYESELYDNEPFYKDLFRRMDNGLQVRSIGPSGGIYNKFPDLFADHGWGSCWAGLDSEGKTDLYHAFKTKGYSVQHAFENAFMMSRTQWAQVFDTDMGTSAMPPTAAEDENGNPIVYKP